MNTIEQLKTLEAAATPGPWEVVGEKDHQSIQAQTATGCGDDDSEHATVCTIPNTEYEYACNYHDNGPLIAAMRNSIKRLIAVVEACQHSTDECHQACSSRDNCDCGYVDRCHALEALGL